MRVDYRMQYYDVISITRWLTAAMEIVVLAYLSEKRRPYSYISGGI